MSVPEIHHYPLVPRVEDGTNATIIAGPKSVENPREGESIHTSSDSGNTSKIDEIVKRVKAEQASPLPPSRLGSRSRILQGFTFTSINDSDPYLSMSKANVDSASTWGYTNLAN